jgi:hypothetical protein
MGRGKSRRSLELIEASLEILREIQPATVRAVCYRLFTLWLIDSMSKNNTNKVGRQLTDARERGWVPWAWVVDETRSVEAVATWADPERFAETVTRAYRRNKWAAQASRVEVWSEKGTVRGTLAPVLDQYEVPFRVMHGFASATTVQDIAAASLATEQPLVVLYVGDWDPSGLHMSEADLPQRLHDDRVNACEQRGIAWWNDAHFEETDITIERVALSAEGSVHRQALATARGLVGGRDHPERTDKRRGRGSTMTMTVDQDSTVQAIHAELVDLSETQTRLAARHHALSAILARRFDSRIPVAPEVADVSVADAGREMNEIDRQLIALERRMDARHAALTIADFEAQAKIVAAVTAEYREIIEAQERAKADEREGLEIARLAFLADLRRRGVFQTPVIAEGG